MKNKVAVRRLSSRSNRAAPRWLSPSRPVPAKAPASPSTRPSRPSTTAPRQLMFSGCCATSPAIKRFPPRSAPTSRRGHSNAASLPAIPRLRRLREASRAGQHRPRSLLVFRRLGGCRQRPARHRHRQCLSRTGSVGQLACRHQPQQRWFRRGRGSRHPQFGQTSITQRVLVPAAAKLSSASLFRASLRRCRSTTALSPRPRPASISKPWSMPEAALRLQRHPPARRSNFRVLIAALRYGISERVPRGLALRPGIVSGKSSSNSALHRANASPRPHFACPASPASADPAPPAGEKSQIRIPRNAATAPCTKKPQYQSRSAPPRISRQMPALDACPSVKHPHQNRQRADECNRECQTDARPVSGVSQQRLHQCQPAGARERNQRGPHQNFSHSLTPRSPVPSCLCSLFPCSLVPLFPVSTPPSAEIRPDPSRALSATKPGM